MSQIKINVKNLSSELSKIKIQKNLFHTSVKSIKVIHPTNGKGKTEEKLVSVDTSYKKLYHNLDTLMGSVKVFLSCSKDGIVDADEYITKVMKNLG